MPQLHRDIKCRITFGWEQTKEIQNFQWRFYVPNNQSLGSHWDRKQRNLYVTFTVTVYSGIRTNSIKWRWNERTFPSLVLGGILLSTVIILILHIFISLFGEGNGNPLQYSCLENLMVKRAWWATVHGDAKSRTRLSNSHTYTHTHTVTVLFCCCCHCFSCAIQLEWQFPGWESYPGPW